MSPPVTRWRFSLATTPALRALVCVAVGLTVGPVVGLVALVLATLASTGVDRLVVAVAGALLVGLGVGSGRALVALASDDTTAGGHADTRALSRRWLVGSGLAGAGVSVVVFVTSDVGMVPWFGSLVAGVAALVIGAGLRSEGAVDADDGVVDYRGRTIPLAAIRRVESVRVGGFVLAVVRYHAGRVGASTPRFLVLSIPGRDAIESSVSGSAAAPPEAGAERGPTAVRLVAATFGVACIAVGPVLWILVPDGRLIAAYLGAFGLLFGALFVRYALVA